MQETKVKFLKKGDVVAKPTPNTLEGSHERSTQLSPPDVLSPVVGSDSSMASISPTWANVVRLSKLNDGKVFKPHHMDGTLLIKNTKARGNIDQECLRRKEQVKSINVGIELMEVIE